MKGYIFVFVFFVCLATAAQAQLKFDREIQTGLFVPKGAWLVGTTLSYTELRSTDFKLLVLKDLNGDGYTFKISPFGGYFFADNVAATVTHSVPSAFLYWNSIGSVSLLKSEVP